MELLTKLFTWFFQPRYENTEEYRWLCNSSDVADLERKLKMLERGKAPFQIFDRNRGAY